MDKSRGWWRENGKTYVNVEFNLTEEEYQYQLRLLEDSRSVRIEQEIRLHYAEMKTLREIADIVKISKSQVHKDLIEYRKTALKARKLDVDKNGRAAGLLIELEAQTNNRIRLLYQKYDEMEMVVQVLRIGIKRTYERVKKNPNARIRDYDKIKSDAREIRIHIETQRNIMSQLRSETQQLLNINNTFGLCGQDASSFVSTAGNRYDEIIQEVQEYLMKLIYIVKQEVEDEEIRHRMFGRMSEVAREIGHIDRRKNKPDEEVTEYRLHT